MIDLVAVSRSRAAPSSYRRSGTLCRQAAAVAIVRSARRRGELEDVAEGLNLTGHFLTRDVLTDRSTAESATRARGSSSRLRRVGGLA